MDNPILPMLLKAISALAIAAAAVGVTATSAFAASQVVGVEAETFNRGPNTAVVSDSNAYGGQAAKMTASKSAEISKDLNNTGTISHISMRVKRSEGNCSPHVKLLTQHQNSNGTWGPRVSQGTRQFDRSYSWSEWSNLSIPAGNNRIIMKQRCPATVWVDYVDYTHDPSTSGTDTTPPDTAITSGPAGGSTQTTGAASFGFSSSEANSTFECFLDTGAYGACTLPKSYTGLANGSHTFSVRARDAAGNVDPTPATRTWTVAADTDGGGVVLGVFGGNAHNGGSQDNGVEDYIADVGRKPEVVQTFMPFKWQGSYVGFPAAGLDHVYNDLQAPGGMAMMTWEPTDTSVGGCQSEFTNDAIIDGQHDTYIRQYLTRARDWGKPIIIRFQHEVNGDWYAWAPNCYDNTPQKSAEAFRHVVNISRRVGATNVKWMFAPHQEFNIGGDNVHGGFDAFYPGDSYTDYVGLDLYNWGSSRNMAWSTPTQCVTDDLSELRALGTDPVWIAESGTHEQYDGRKPAWFRDLRSLLKNEWSFVRGYVYFSNNQEGATWDIDSTSESLTAYREMVNAPYFQAQEP